MNILIDTNIIIPLEDTGRLLDPKFAEMRRLSAENKHTLFIHPNQKDDILRDKNAERREIVLSRLGQYPAIQSPPQLTDDDLVNYGWTQNNDNDRVDNLLLHALCRGAVNFLVTNDRKIHTKAKLAGVQEQVHLLDQFLVYLQNQITPDSIPPFGIQHKNLYEFDLNEPLFDSLRKGYPEFDDWYKRSAASNRKAWCVVDTKLQAICIYKEESNSIIVDGGTPVNGKILKLCTFKVGEELRGRKLGERLLYTAFNFAVNHNFDWIYLHTYGAEHELLVALCEDYGFEFVGKYQERDNVYLKPMVAPLSEVELSPLEFAKKYYPHYHSDSSISKYIVPIQPQYHNDLFADVSDIAHGLFSDDPCMYSPQANTIKKAYICHAGIKKILPGELLLFYRTRDRKSIECIGIVEQVYRETDVERVLPIVSKRTVYSRGELETMLEKEALIILFRHLNYIEPITITDLESVGVCGPIQSIREIPHEKCMELLDET